MYAPENVTNGRGRKMRKLWKEGGFRKGKGGRDQISAIKMVVEV